MSRLTSTSRAVPHPSSSSSPSTRRFLPLRPSPPHSSSHHPIPQTAPRQTPKSSSPAKRHAESFRHRLRGHGLGGHRRRARRVPEPAAGLEYQYYNDDDDHSDPHYIRTPRPAIRSDCDGGPVCRRCAHLPPPAASRRRRRWQPTPLRARRLHAFHILCHPRVRHLCGSCSCRCRHQRRRRASSRARPCRCPYVARFRDGNLLSWHGACLGARPRCWRRTRRGRGRRWARHRHPLEDGTRSGSRARRIDGCGALHHTLKASWTGTGSRFIVGMS